MAIQVKVQASKLLSMSECSYLAAIYANMLKLKV